MKAWQVLAFGGIAIVFVLLVMKGTSKAKTTKPAASGSQGLASTIGAGLGGLIGGLVNSHVSSGPVSQSSGANTVPPNFDTHNYTEQDGYQFTDANGNFVAG